MIRFGLLACLLALAAQPAPAALKIIPVFIGGDPPPASPQDGMLCRSNQPCGVSSAKRTRSETEATVFVSCGFMSWISRIVPSASM